MMTTSFQRSGWLTLVVPLFVFGGLQTARAFLNPLRRCIKGLSVGRNSNNSNKMPEYYEVEEKFAILDGSSSENLADILQNKLGFTRSKGPVSFVDVYFDTPSFDLVRHDHWLRCRNATWQLKVGNPNKQQQSKNTAASKATVYQEFQNDKALQIVQEFLSSQERRQHKSEEKLPILLGRSVPFHDTDPAPHTVPTLPNLQPFAKISTTRTSWKRDAIAVDLDETDLGHAVGEVEVVVQNPSEIEMARGTVQGIVAQLLPPTSIPGVGTPDPAAEPAPPVIGKLEYYLARNAPELYGLLVRTNIL